MSFPFSFLNGAYYYRLYPNTYEPSKDLNRLNVRYKRGERTPSPDFRRPINPNINAVRKNVAEVKIAPEHEITLGEILKDYEKTKNGPGKYYPSHKLVEERVDKGVQPFNKADIEKKEIELEDLKLDLYPNYNYNKWNKLVFKYYKPADVGPTKMTDAQLNPGRWVYYDVNLDAVRAELAKDVYFGAKGEDAEQFKEREEFLQMLEAHIKRKRDKRPEHGDYHPDQPVEIAGMVDFDRMVGRPEIVEPDDVDD